MWKGKKDFFEFLSSNKYLLILIFASFFINIFYLDTESFWPDEALYLWIAENPFGEFSTMSTFSVQLPMILMALLTPFFGALVSGKVIVLILSTLGVVFTYLIGKELWKDIYGFFAAVLLLLTPQYLFFSTRVLLDVPLTAMIVMATYFLIRFEKERTRETAILAGLFSTLTVFTKSAGFIFPAIVVAFFVLAYGKKFFQQLKDRNFLIFAGVFFSVLAVFFILNLSIFGRILPRGSAYTEGVIFTQDWSYYFAILPQLLFLLPLLLFILGTAMMVVNFKSNSNKLLLLVSISYFLFFSFFIGEKVPRYILPFFPFFFLAISYLLHSLKLKNAKYEYIFLALLLYFSYRYLVSANSLILGKKYTYTGFPEAGRWLSNYASDEDIVLAGSRRAIRAFSGFDYEQSGGIVSLLPSNLTSLQTLADSANRTVFMEIDIWEYTQPGWAYPLTEEKFNNITGIGFDLANIVVREIQTQQGLTEQAVIFLFMKSP